MIDDAYMYDHCKGELGRGHDHRCPTSWLQAAKRHARLVGDTDMVLACDIALRGMVTGPVHRQMRKLAGRQLA